MLARDTSARPGELLAVKIGDIKIKKAVGANKNKMFAQVEVGRYGKRKKTRIVPLINSLPYLKAWLAQHPMGQANPNAYLFISLENSARYRNVPLKSSSLFGLYRNLRIYHFPTKILIRPDIPPEEKAILKRLIENKPWNPYNRPHTALTEKATILGDFNLRQHAGWTKDSKMLDVYTHELGDESMEGLLLAYGIDTDNKQERRRQQALVEARTCPHSTKYNYYCNQCHYKF